MFKSMAKVDLVHIPYKGSGAAQIDLLAGQVDMMFDSLPTSATNVRAGKLRALAVTGSMRSPLFPAVPTVAESGLPGYESTAWLGLVAPTGTPEEIIRALNAKVIEAARGAGFRERWEPLGYQIIADSPERMSAMLEADIARWAPVVKASGAKLD
jgi:tripartite-type tricarboxylate transporter receptor subunit TctC